MTELQKVQFELLKKVISICDLHGIKYYLVCGSALGAAKYKGFIPWDDDVDVALPRDDYERFCEIAKDELPDYYFLQNAHTDKNCFLIYSKLRDSRTTFIEQSVSRLDINHGVYIDIFPLDFYCTSEKAKKFERVKKFYNLVVAANIIQDKTFKMKIVSFPLRMLTIVINPSKIAIKMEKYIIKTQNSKSAIYCNHGNWQGKLEYASYEQYGEGLWTEFEGLKVRIPEKYDEYLTQKYGDWRADLPEDQKVGHHYCSVCDLIHPYTYYVEKLSNGKIRIKNNEEVKLNSE